MPCFQTSRLQLLLILTSSHPKMEQIPVGTGHAALKSLRFDFKEKVFGAVATFMPAPKKELLKGPAI